VWSWLLVGGRFVGVRDVEPVTVARPAGEFPVGVPTLAVVGALVVVRIENLAVMVGDYDFAVDPDRRLVARGVSGGRRLVHIDVNPEVGVDVVGVDRVGVLPLVENPVKPSGVLALLAGAPVVLGVLTSKGARAVVENVALAGV